jgi:hypothetical protein
MLEKQSHFSQIPETALLSFFNGLDIKKEVSHIAGG